MRDEGRGTRVHAKARRRKEERGEGKLSNSEGPDGGSVGVGCEVAWRCASRAFFSPLATAVGDPAGGPRYRDVCTLSAAGCQGLFLCHRVGPGDFRMNRRKQGERRRRVEREFFGVFHYPFVVLKKGKRGSMAT